MKPNLGYRPDGAKGKRVNVILANGRPGRTDSNPMSPPGWPADPPTRWTITGHPFDIAEYEVLK